MSLITRPLTFRSQKVEPVFKDIVKQILLLLAQEGLVSLKEIYVDGTKIEANANRYTFVWGMQLIPIKKRWLSDLMSYGNMLDSSERRIERYSSY